MTRFACLKAISSAYFFATYANLSGNVHVISSEKAGVLHVATLAASFSPITAEEKIMALSFNDQPSNNVVNRSESSSTANRLVDRRSKFHNIWVFDQCR